MQNNGNKFFELTLQENNAIWVLALNNPPANALTMAILSEGEALINDFLNNGKAKVLILTATGDRAFSSGVNINEIDSITSGSQGAKIALKGQNLCDLIGNSDKPIIAAINALCIGGGNEIAIACHMRIASERAKFGQPEINIGIIPGFGGTQRLPRLIGASQARKLMLTGDIISAQEALRIGLVDEVVKDEALLKRALHLAGRIIRNSMMGVFLTQEAIRKGMGISLAEGLAVENDCFKRMCDTEDMKEGVRAFKERRVPNFKDR